MLFRSPPSLLKGPLSLCQTPPALTHLTALGEDFIDFLYALAASPSPLQPLVGLRFPFLRVVYYTAPPTKGLDSSIFLLRPPSQSRCVFYRYLHVRPLPPNTIFHFPSTSRCLFPSGQDNQALHSRVFLINTFLSRPPSEPRISPLFFKVPGCPSVA